MNKNLRRNTFFCDLSREQITDTPLHITKQLIVVTTIFRIYICFFVSSAVLIVIDVLGQLYLAPFFQYEHKFNIPKNVKILRTFKAKPLLN